PLASDCGAYAIIAPNPLNGEYSVVQLPSSLAKRLLAGSHTPDSQKIHSAGTFFDNAAGNSSCHFSWRVIGMVSIGSCASVFKNAAGCKLIKASFQTIK